RGVGAVRHHPRRRSGSGVDPRRRRRPPPRSGRERRRPLRRRGDRKHPKVARAFQASRGSASLLGERWGLGGKPPATGLWKPRPAARPPRHPQPKKKNLLFGFPPPPRGGTQKPLAPAHT